MSENPESWLLQLEPDGEHRLITTPESCLDQLLLRNSFELDEVVDEVGELPSEVKEAFGSTFSSLGRLKSLHMALTIPVGGLGLPRLMGLNNKARSFSVTMVDMARIVFR